MYATDLIGKRAIRIAPNKNGDKSIRDPIIIKRANEYYIVYEYADKWSRTYMDTDEHVLNYDFCDDNWVEFK